MAGRAKSAAPNEVAEDVHDVLDGWTEKTDAGGTRLRLEHPYTYGGDTHDHVLVRRITAKAMRRLPVDGGSITFDHFLQMAEVCCAMTASEVDQLSIPDASRLVAVIAADFGGGPGSGAT